MVKAIMDRVFIRLDTATKKTSGGLILSDEPHLKTTGIVESVGEEVRCVSVGQRVLFHLFDELPTYDKEIVVVRENSLLGVFEDE